MPKRALARREGARRSRDERIRKQGEDSELLEPPATSLPTPSQGKALDRKIASYKDRIRRTSMQLLVALAAGSQSTDPEIQSRQSHSTTVTSSTSNSTDGDNNEIPISAMAQTIGAQTSSTSSRGDWADEIAAPIMDKYMKRVFLSGAGQAQPSSPKAGDLNTGKPSNAPDPSVYDSRLWKRLEYTDDAAWLNKNSVFEQPKDHTPEGWATWKTQEKTYPSLAVILGRQKVDMDKLWDPDQRSLEEKKRAQHGRAGSGHPHLEPSSITLLSLERRIGFERREMNPLYRHYSQVPVSLPARVSDEDMSHGHIKTPPPLPLEAPSGYKVSLAPKLDPNPSEVETARRKRLRISRKDMGPVPEAQYDYPTDLPANPTFKFSGGRGVADFAKLNPIDETRHVRGSQQIRDAGEIMAAQEAPFVEPYTFEGKMPPQPPGFKMPPLVKRSREERDKAEAELAAKRKEFHEGMLGKLQARGHSFDPHDPFWHYEGMGDEDSLLHQPKRRKTSDQNKGGEDSQGNVGTTLPHPPNTPIADGEEPQEDIATNNPSNVSAFIKYLAPLCNTPCLNIPNTLAYT